MSDIIALFREALMEITSKDRKSSSKRRKYKEERTLYEEEFDILVKFFGKMLEEEDVDVMEEFRRILEDDIKVKRQ